MNSGMVNPTGNGNLFDDALRIGLAGTASVAGDRSVLDHVSQEGSVLQLGERSVELSTIERCFVFGGGKAVDSMARGIERSAIGKIFSNNLTGLVNIPAKNSPFAKTDGSHLENAFRSQIERAQVRPTGINEPTTAAVESSRKMRHAIGKCGVNDLVIFLISGGGSALIIDPVDGVELEDIISVTRSLSQNGMPIEQLNVVRSAICKCKSGGLARICRSQNQIGFILSDTMDNAIQTIASGPTTNARVDFQQAIGLLKDADARLEESAQISIDRAIRAIESRADEIEAKTETAMQVDNFIVANNASAVDAAGVQAVQLGYDYWLQSGKPQTETVDETAARMIEFIRKMLAGQLPANCIVDGGEPTVVIQGKPGLGGRNQHLVLLLYSRLESSGLLDSFRQSKMCFVSLATDGEDGNTDAAGAILNTNIINRLSEKQKCVRDALSGFDSHSLLKSVGAVIETDATNTNVCDLRVLTKPISN